MPRKPRSTFGPAYEAAIDGPRIARQHEQIRDLCITGYWRTLSEIAKLTGYPEASVSAQLRHLRKPAFGEYIVDKRRRDGAGLWEYQVRRPGPTHQLNLLEAPCQMN